MTALDVVTRRAATGLSRRTFFRRVGGAGLGLGLAAAGFSLRPDSASAAGSCSGGACGPSPRCDYVIITGLCLSGGCSTGYKGRKYNTYQCVTSGEGGYWDESWSSSCASPGTWRCRDCAMKCNTGGAAVSGCGSSGWYACIRVKRL